MFWMFGSGSLKDAVPMIEEFTRGPARVQVRTAAIADAVLILLGLLLVRFSDGLFSGLPLLVGLVAAVPTAVFAWRRWRLAGQVTQWKAAQAATLDADATDTAVDYSPMFEGQEPSDSREIVVIDEDGNEWSTPGHGQAPRRADGTGAPQTDGTSASSGSRASESSRTSKDRARMSPAEAARADEAQRMHDAMLEEQELRDTWMPRVEAAQRAAIAAAGGTVNAPYLKDDLRVTLASYIGVLAGTPIVGLFIFLAIIGLL